MAIEVENNDNRKPCDGVLISGLDGEENHFENIVINGLVFEKKDDGSPQILQIKNVKNLQIKDVVYE